MLISFNHNNSQCDGVCCDHIAVSQLIFHFDLRMASERKVQAAILFSKMFHKQTTSMTWWDAQTTLMKLHHEPFILSIKVRKNSKMLPSQFGFAIFFFCLSRALAGVRRHPQIFSYWVSNFKLKPHRKPGRSQNQFFAQGGEASSWFTPGRTYVQVCRAQFRL